MAGDNKCSCLNTICDDGVVCNLNTKACPTVTIPETCKDAQSFCTSSKYYICQNHEWTESSDSQIQSQCKMFGCLPDESACAECLKDACVEGKMVTCENGKIKSTTPCKTNACENDTKCEDFCTEGEKTCKNGELFICRDNALVKEKDCPAGCDEVTNNSCASSCNENETYCVNGKTRTCKNGVLSDDAEACPNGASCKDQNNCGECKDDVTICENGQIKNCSNGAWGLAVACTGGYSCKDAISCGDCKDNETKCDNVEKDNQKDVGIVSHCVHGQWVEEDSACRDDSGNPVSCNVDKDGVQKCGECLNDIPRCVNMDVNNYKEVGVMVKCENGALLDIPNEERVELACMDKELPIPFSCKNEFECGICHNSSADGAGYCVTGDEAGKPYDAMYKCVNGVADLKQEINACSLSRCDEQHYCSTK